MTKKSGNDSNSQAHEAKPIEKPTAAVSKPTTAKPTGPPNVSFKTNVKVQKK